MPNATLTKLSPDQKVKWKLTLKLFETEPYNQLHIWASEDYGWCWLSNYGKRMKITYQDSMQRIQTICDILLK